MNLFNFMYSIEEADSLWGTEDIDSFNGFKEINRFLSGTGVQFEGGRLSFFNSYRLLSLINAYLSEIHVNIPMKMCSNLSDKDRPFICDSFICDSAKRFEYVFGRAFSQHTFSLYDVSGTIISDSFTIESVAAKRGILTEVNNMLTRTIEEMFHFDAILPAVQVVLTINESDVKIVNNKQVISA